MGVIDAPQWLLPAFSRSLRALGTTAPAEQISAAGEQLVALWSTPDRRFHNLRHLIDMLARVDELADESHHPDIMRVATWYHGCVFSAEAEQVHRRNGGEDEAASAAFAAQDLSALGVPDRAVERVCSLIINLQRHTLSTDDIDAMALIDADLGILAVDPQTYKEYLRLLREEYAHIPQADYLRARLAITSRLLGRDRLFHSPLGQRWEPLARENLEAEGRRVADMLAELDPEEADGGVPTDGEPPAAPPREQTAPAAPATALGSSLSEEPDDGAEHRGRPPRPDTAGEGSTAPAPDAQVAASTEIPPSRIQSAPAPSAASARTPARGMAALAPSEDSAAPATTPGSAPGGIDATLSHAPSMESCAEDLERLLGSPRPGQERSASRHDLAQEESARLAEKLRLKAEAAKIAREARTGELTPITEEIIDDGADEL